MKQAIVPRGEHFVALAVIRSLGKKNIKTLVISENTNALSFYSKYCSARIASDKSVNLFSDFIEDDLIMPTEEASMIELSKNRKKYSCTLAFPDYSILETAFDKKKVLERAGELGIPFPKSIFVESLDSLDRKIDQIPFPAAIKPIRSLGGVGISFVNSPDLIKTMYIDSVKNFGPVIIQDKIPYDERYSVAILMDFEQNMRRCCVLKAVRCYPIDTGPASFVETVDRPDLIAMGERILESIHYSGIAEIEFVIDKRDNEPKLMEINPRFWGSLQGAISAGVDFPALLFDLFQEGNVEKNIDYKLGVKTRNVIPYEYQRLRRIIQGTYSTSYKISSVVEFLKFFKDDAYFIFAVDDLQPFLSLFIKSMRMRIRKLMNNPPN